MPGLLESLSGNQIGAEPTGIENSIPPGLLQALSIVGGGQGNNPIMNMVMRLGLLSQNTPQTPDLIKRPPGNPPSPYMQPTVNNTSRNTSSSFTVDPVQELTKFGYTDPTILSNVPKVAGSIGQFESGGNYSAHGPTTKSGDRAYGRYQVMGNNIPAWTKEALGVSMSPQEFLASPAAQDRVALYRMAQYHQKYGNPSDVASVWFSGRPQRGNNSRDVLGTSVPQYVNNVVGGM